MKAELLSHFGDDLMVVNAARVSVGKWKEKFDEQDAKLIHYLATHKHESPFFHPQIQFRLTAPIFVARQWFRHEVGFSRNEISRRYVDHAPTFFEPDTWRRRPNASIKQGSGSDLPEHEDFIAGCEYADALIKAERTYDGLLALGVAPEQARMILPQSMNTSWIETASLMAYARLCNLRIEPHAQLEIRQLAEQVAEQIEPLFPISWPELTR